MARKTIPLLRTQSVCLERSVPATTRRAATGGSARAAGATAVDTVRTTGTAAAPRTAVSVDLDPSIAAAVAVNIGPAIATAVAVYIGPPVGVAIGTSRGTAVGGARSARGRPAAGTSRSRRTTSRSHPIAFGTPLEPRTVIAPRVDRAAAVSMNARCPTARGRRSCAGKLGRTTSGRTTP